MDVTNDAEVGAAAESCPDVNIVVNNAGIGFAVSALSTKVATKGRAMFDTNVFGISTSPVPSHRSSKATAAVR